MKLKMVLPVLIFLIAASAIQPAIAQPPSGMVSYWKFEEGSGTTAIDSVGVNNGTIHGAIWTTGIVGSALSFDGVDDYVYFGDVLDPKTSDWTIEAWTKTSEHGMPINKYHSWGLPYIGFYWNYVNSSRSDFAVVDTDRHVVVARVTKNLIDGKWHHVAMVIDNTNDKVDVYVDGELNATETGTIYYINTNYPLLFGRRLDDPQNYFWFNGTMDEVAVYNRVLTPEEILEHYQNVLPPPLTVETWMTDSDFNNITSFRAVFTPYRNTGDYKLRATNPGQFYFNILVNNTGTTTRNITITYNIDPNFTTQGAKPIHVYTDINKIIDITADCTFSDNTITAYYVDPNAIIYVTIHLDYALKGTTWTKSQVDAWYSEHTFSATADAVVSAVTITDPESIIPPIPSYLIFLIAILPMIMLCLGIFIAPLKYAPLSTKRRK